jgi:Tfp pilus assembly protein PilX
MKNFFPKQLKMTQQKGYTLLFAVLVTSIVLGVSISILSISRKEFILSASARESQFAFYAADSGLECAAYHDLDSGLLSFDGTSTEQFSITCGEQTTLVTPTYTGDENQPSAAHYEFNLLIGTNLSCAIVTVDKGYTYETVPVGDQTIVTTSATTTILSKGYNIGWNTTESSCTASSTKKVERALRLTH